MKKNYIQLLCNLLILLSVSLVQAYPHEVWQSGNLYYWRNFDVQQGSSPDLATAIQSAIGTGNRELHILTGGTLSQTINLQENLILRFHNNTLIKGHGGTGLYREGSGGIAMYDLTLTRSDGSGFGIRTSRASDLTFNNIRIFGGGIGIRVDSHPSRPYEDGRWVFNLEVENCHFEDTSGHGLETYGVDGFTGNNLVARNCGECGVLLNKTINGTIGTVDAYRCDYGGGYAGLRYANNCANITAQHLIARECGRGYFVLTGSNNITLESCEITDCTDIGIWMQDVVNSTVESGCTNSGVAVTGSGSYANVSTSCNTSYYRLQNRETALFLDGMGRTTNGSDVGQYSNTSHINAQWSLEPSGNYYKLQNRGTGLYLDGMGRTSDGDNCGQWSSSTHNNQQWERISVGNYFKLRNRATGKYLDGMGRTANGDATGLWSDSPSYNQQWSFLSISSSSSMAAMESTNFDTNSKLEIQEPFDVSVYPTTVDDQFNVALEMEDMSGGDIEVFSSSGSLVKRQNFASNISTVDISRLPPGIYILKIHTGKDSVSRRVIKR